MAAKLIIYKIITFKSFKNMDSEEEKKEEERLPER